MKVPEIIEIRDLGDEILGGGWGEFGRIWVWVFYTILGLGFGAKTWILVRKHGFWCENIDFCAKTLIFVRKH